MSYYIIQPYMLMIITQCVLFFVHLHFQNEGRPVHVPTDFPHRR
jgi:hypothetical protein